MVRSVVVFPAPLDPRRVTPWPSGTSNDTSQSATTPLYAARTPVTDNNGSAVMRFRRVVDAPGRVPHRSRGGGRLAKIRLDYPWIVGDVIGRPFGDLLAEIQYDHAVADR